MHFGFRTETDSDVSHCGDWEAAERFHRTLTGR
jgi:hypothetical protein